MSIKSLVEQVFFLGGGGVINLVWAGVNFEKLRGGREGSNPKTLQVTLKYKPSAIFSPAEFIRILRNLLEEIKNWFLILASAKFSCFWTHLRPPRALLCLPFDEALPTRPKIIFLVPSQRGKRGLFCLGRITCLNNNYSSSHPHTST